MLPSTERRTSALGRGGALCESHQGFVERKPWLGGAINYHMGVDGISLPFVILTTALMPICIIASWESVQTRVKEYMIAFLVLETMMVGMFCALDMVLFQRTEDGRAFA